MSHHLVCHDCDAEGIVEDERTARDLVQLHEEVKGHSAQWEKTEKTEQED